MSDPVGVAVDPVAGRIWWASESRPGSLPGVISFANLNGSGGSDLASARTRGTRVTYRISEAATVTVRVQHVLPGHRVRGRCVARTPANRTKPRCKRYRTLAGSFRHAGKAGLNTFRFTGRLAGRTLAPRSYRLVAVARDRHDNTSRPSRRLFRIIP